MLDFESSRTSTGINDEPQNYFALILRLASFFRVLRTRLIARARSSYTTNAGTEDSAAVSAARTRSNATSGSRADSATASRANTRSGPNAVRWRSSDYRDFGSPKFGRLLFASFTCGG